MLSFSTPIEKTKITNLAIGRFDGMHLGHFELFKHLDENGALFVITKEENKALTPRNFRATLVDFPLIFCDFYKIKDYKGEDFLKLLRQEFPKLEKIIVGYDFRFGKERKCSAKDIQSLCGVNTIIVDEFKIQNKSVHASMVKTLLKEAKVQEAKNFLGRFYTIKANIIKGQGIGAKELVATLNLHAKDFILPKDGVYATLVKIENKSYYSVSFIGIRSTDKNFALETHILDEKFTNTNAKSVELSFIGYIRANEKFNNLALLKAQISKDIKKAKEILGRSHER
ncbi:bifunctional riboflavin kinase/FAD synthetase [Campylobacter subantarcticus]|uniref:Riboflavin biosynthesis protein n=1 Tax=Campylobacter subantarcticus LMG 24374 TaxID=1388751 RepID=A0A0A8H928_9BACT|nr:bifunctional riboflavin kinase/FAD synthetase [Campylobacter subantarcticus]AJC90571.1 bifunctional riboflavin kinase / FMN adenylyltransferase [Campylobacter subantarcticus LMG 24374]EAJ1260643.1 bifunctional riboflavin kinase/FMN adenylyltransferase [Campylobacter lari]